MLVDDEYVCQWCYDDAPPHAHCSQSEYNILFYTGLFAIIAPAIVFYNMFM